MTKRENAIQLLRWIAVLPTAVVALLATQFLIGLLMRLVGGWPAQSESGLVDYLQLLAFHYPKEATFVIAGAKMAPRGRSKTALVLATAAILISLIIHILGQSNPGVVNDTHFAAEALGAITGAVFMHFSEKKTQRMARRDNGIV